MADNQASNPKENLIQISTGVPQWGITKTVIGTGEPLFTWNTKAAKPPADPVNHPSHYTAGGMEVLDILKAKLTPEEFRGFLKGNVLKYNLRERYKNGLQDLEKAQFYQNRLIHEEKCKLRKTGLTTTQAQQAE